MLKKTTWLLLRVVPLLLIALALWQVPGYIEERVNEKLNPEEIKVILSRAVQERTGLILRIRGVRFELKHGFIFSGVRLERSAPLPNHPFVLRTENLILKVSYWKWITGSFPFSRLFLQRGKLDPWALSLKEWTEIFRVAGTAASVDDHASNSKETEGDSSAIALHTGLSFQGTFMENTGLEARSLEIVAFPEGESSGSLISPSFVMDLEARPSSNHYILEAESSLVATGKKEGSLVAKGEWIPGETKRLFFQYRELNAPFLFQLLKQIGFTTSHPFVSDPILQTGTVSGKGSMHIYESGVGLDATGNYNQLSFYIPIDDQPFMGLTGRNGKFAFNSGFDENYEKPAFVTLDLTEPGIQLHYLQRDARIKPEENRIEIKSDIDISRAFYTGKENGVATGVVAPHVPRNGKLQFALKLDNHSGPGLPTTPEISLSLKDLIPFMNTDDTPPPIVFDNLQYQIRKNGKIDIRFQGRLYSGRFSGTGKGQAHTAMISDGRIVLKRESEIRTDVENGSYRDMILGINEMYSYLLSEGSKKNARMTEDMGPVWKNKFRDTDLFAYIVRPEEFDLQVHFIKMREENQGLPENPVLRVQKRSESMQANLLDSIGPSGQLQLHYQANFEQSLPHHDLRMKGEVYNNRMSFPTILQTDIPPESMRFDYSYSGEGVLFGDIVNRSYSSIALDLDKADLSGLSRVKAANHRHGIPEAFFRKVDLRYRSSTDGPIHRYNTIQILSEKIDIRGRGQYEPFSGGSVSFYYYLKQPINSTPSTGRFDFRILKNRSWIPESNQ